MSLTCPKPNKSLWKITELTLNVKIQIVTLKTRLLRVVIVESVFTKDLPRHVGRVLRTTDLSEELFISSLNFLASLTQKM